MKIRLETEFDCKPWNDFQKLIISSSNKIINTEDKYLVSYHNSIFEVLENCSEKPVLGLVKPTKFEIDVALFEEKFTFPLNKIFDIARDGKYTDLIFVTENIGFDCQCFSYIYNDIFCRNIEDINTFFFQVKNLRDISFEEIEIDFSLPHKFLILINKNFEDSIPTSIAKDLINELYKQKNVVLKNSDMQMQERLKAYEKDLYKSYKVLDKDRILDYVLLYFCSSEDLHSAIHETDNFKNSELTRYKVETDFPLEQIKGQHSSVSISCYTEKKLSDLIQHKRYFYINTTAGDKTLFTFPSFFLQEKDIKQLSEEERKRAEETDNKRFCQIKKRHDEFQKLFKKSPFLGKRYCGFVNRKIKEDLEFLYGRDFVKRNASFLDEVTDAPMLPKNIYLYNQF